MSAATTAIVAVGVSAAAAAASAAAKKRAAGKAANARDEALNQLQTLDIPGINKDAAAADEASYAGRLDLQKRVDPKSAEARGAGLDALVSNINAPQEAQAQSFINQVADEQADPQLDALRSKLLMVAQDALDSGATMTPEFQAELVRTGLETAGRSGLPIDRAGASGQSLRRVTGVAGEVLKERRLNQATTAAGAAQSISTTRANILGGLVGQLQGLMAGKTARAATAFQAGASQTPESYGLTGDDVARLTIANVELENERILGKGEVKAGRALANGEYISSLIGAGSSAASGALGLFGGKT